MFYLDCVSLVQNVRGPGYGRRLPQCKRNKSPLVMKRQNLKFGKEKEMKGNEHVSKVWVDVLDDIWTRSGRDPDEIRKAHSPDMAHSCAPEERREKKREEREEREERGERRERRERREQKKRKHKTKHSPNLNARFETFR